MGHLKKYDIRNGDFGAYFRWDNKRNVPVILIRYRREFVLNIPVTIDLIADLLKAYSVNGKQEYNRSYNRKDKDNKENQGYKRNKSYKNVTKQSKGSNSENKDKERKSKVKVVKGYRKAIKGDHNA